jgi:hypothetical protein
MRQYDRHRKHGQIIIDEDDKVEKNLSTADITKSRLLGNLSGLSGDLNIELGSIDQINKGAGLNSTGAIPPIVMTGRSRTSLKSSESTGGAFSMATSYFYPLEPPPYRIMDENTYEILLDHCRIRPLKPGLDAPPEVDDNWSIEMGLFKPYLKERKPKLYLDCFEADWQSMKKLKYKHTTEDEVKVVMAKVYPKLKHAYKYYAGINMSGMTPSIGQIVGFKFMDEELHCVDADGQGFLKPSDIDRLTITVNVNNKGQHNPKNQMVRFQFIEWIIRSAIEKFYTSK